MTYTLILTMALFSQDARAGAAHSSIASVPGFATHHACVEAGDRWIAQQRSIKVRGQLSAMCVPIGQPAPRP